MILSSKTIRNLIQYHGLITPIPDEERLQHIEGNCYDLTLAAIRRSPQVEPTEYLRQLAGQQRPFFGVENRSIPPLNNVDFFRDEEGRQVALCRPGVPYILISNEIITCPPGVEAQVIARSSFFSAGSFTQGTFIPFGFSDTIRIHFSIPIGGQEVIFEKNARFCGLKFHKVDSSNPDDLDPYKGIWTNGRESTNGEKIRAF